MGYDYDKIACIRKQMAEKRKQLNTEKDFNARKKLEMEIKILELKAMIEKIK